MIMVQLARFLVSRCLAAVGHGVVEGFEVFECIGFVLAAFLKMLVDAPVSKMPGFKILVAESRSKVLSDEWVTIQ